MASDKFSTPTSQPASESSAVSIGVPVAAGIGSAIYNEWSQREAERRQQKRYEQNVAMNYKFARQAERDSALNQKYGLQNAGLSTALASEGKFSAPALASAPSMPDAHGQRIDPMSASALMNDALNRELLKEEIRSKDIDNTRKEDADATYDRNVRNTLDKILQNPNLSSDDRKWFEGMRENSHSYSLGSAEGLDKFVSLDTKIQTSKLEKNEASFKSDLLEFKRENGGIEAIAKMDIAQLNSLVMHTAQARMQIMALATSIPKTEQEIRTLESQAMKNIAEAHSIYHGDVAELWKQKDFQALIAHYVDVGISEGVALLGVAGKAKVAGKMTKGLVDSLNKGHKYGSKAVLGDVGSVKSSSSKKFSMPRSKARSKARSHREASTKQMSLKFPR